MPSKIVLAAFPVIVFVLSYVLTTLAAATGYMFGFTHWLLVRQGPALQAALAEIGSPSYLALLYLPLILTPAAALLIIFVMRPWLAGQNTLILPAHLTISRPAVAALIGISAVYCFVTLLKVDALNADVFATGTFVEKTTRRMTILESGCIFFAFAYGINMILPLIAFISYVQQGRRAADGALFIVAYFLFVTVIVLTYSKAPIGIYVVLALATFAVIRPPMLPAVAMVVVSIAIFAFTNAALLQPALITETPTVTVAPISNPATPAPSPAAAPDATFPDAPVTSPTSSFLAAPAAPLPDTSAAPELNARVAPAAEPSEPAFFTSLSKTLDSVMMKLTLNISIFLNRMAIAHPYHVAIFKDPEERCGIQGNALRKIVGLPPPNCVLPEKAFRLMFLDWIKGYQPAPASLSAYAELGMGWSITVMILSGIVLGGLGSLAACKSGPAAAALCVAICGLGYDLSQVPFLASFTYPHGFFAFLLAVAVAGSPGILKSLNGNSPSEGRRTRSA